MSVGGTLPAGPRDGPGPLRDLDVPPEPLRAPGGGRRAGVVALLAIAVALGVAIGAAQLEPAVRPAPSRADTSGVRASAAAILPPASALGDPTPDPYATPVAVPPRLSREALATAVRSGSLEGRLVFVDGALRVTPVPCGGSAVGATGCVDLAVGGLGLPLSAGTVAIPWRGDPAPGSWLVTVAREEGLVYLGSLVPSREGALSIGLLTRRLLAAELAEPPRTLFEVQGWLVRNPIHPCVTRDAAATPCPTPAPFMAGDEPFQDGLLRSAAGGNVDLAQPVIGVDPGDVVTRGTFLVALPSPCDPAAPAPSCAADSARWQVIARYEPSRSVRVQAP